MVIRFAVIWPVAVIQLFAAYCLLHPEHWTASSR